MDLQDIATAGSAVVVAVGSTLVLTVPMATATEVANATEAHAVQVLRHAVLQASDSIRMTLVDDQDRVVVAQFDNTFEKFKKDFDKAVV